MDINLQDYEKYYIYDKPIPYKDLLILPVKMSEYLEFHMAANCLVLEKNKIPSPDFIRMSYLDFLFYLMIKDENGQFYSSLFLELFRICLDILPEEIKYIQDEKGKFKLILKEIEYDKDDFDNIRKIILFQNIIDYDETYIDPKVEKTLKEAQEFMSRNKKKMCSLEDQLICVLISTALKLDDIYNLSIRKFSKILERVDYKLHYSIYKQAEMSGMVSFEEEIDHWMCDLKKNKYSDVIVDYGEFKNKFQGVT